MRKVVVPISDIVGLQVSGSGRELAHREALGNVGISSELVEFDKVHVAKPHAKAVRQPKAAIPKLDSSAEFGASVTELEKYFIGNVRARVHQLSQLIGEDPSTTDKAALNVDIGKETFDVVLRFNATRRVWAFNKDDMSRFANELNLEIKTENRPTEIEQFDSNAVFGASRSELEKYFIGNATILSRELNQLIYEDPSTTDKAVLSVEIGKETFYVVLRLKGTQRIWAFNKDDIPRLANVLNLSIKTDNRPTKIEKFDSNSEFGASGPELKKYFIGNAAILSRQLSQLIGEDPSKIDKTALNLEIGKEKFDVVLRLKGTTYIWAFKKVDHARLREALNWKQLPENRPTNIEELNISAECGASATNIKIYFVGDSAILARELNQLIAEDPTMTHKTAHNIQIVNESFDIVLRMNGTQPIWAFNIDDLPRLAAAMSWKLKPQKRPNSGLSRLVQRMTFGSTLQNGIATGEV